MDAPNTTNKRGRDYDLQGQIKFTKERCVPEVAEPAKHKPAHDEFWESENVPNVTVIREHLRAEGKFEKSDIIQLLHTVYPLFEDEDNIIALNAPVVVCGDVHGQFYDVLSLFETGGDPSTTSYLFLGDYVDRGDFSVEICILLFTYKILYPQTFLMLRGNHESFHLTSHFQFREECCRKYDEEVYDTIIDVFNALPLCAILNEQFFCVHGGISPDLNSLDDILRLDRFQDTPKSGLMADLLWSDPATNYTEHRGFSPNRERKISYYFGFEAVKAFLEKFQLLAIIRAHEVQDEGYRMFDKTENGFPSVISLFSAPEYFPYQNDAAILVYANNSIVIKKFYHTVHPYYLPHFENVFSWSVPFVSTKVGEILLTFLEMFEDDEIEKEEEKMKEDQDRARNRIWMLGQLIRGYKIAKEIRERELGAQAMNLSKEALVDTKQLPPTVDEIKEQISLGNERLLDLPNEAFPLFDGQKRTLHDSLSKIIKTKKVPLNGSLPCPVSPRPHVHMLSQQQVELMSPRGQLTSPRGLMSPRAREAPQVEEPPLSASKKKAMTNALANSTRHVMHHPSRAKDANSSNNTNNATNTNASSSTGSASDANSGSSGISIGSTDATALSSSTTSSSDSSSIDSTASPAETTVQIDEVKS